MRDDVIQTDSLVGVEKEWGRILDIVGEGNREGGGSYSISLIEYEKPHFSGSHDDTEMIFVLSGQGKARVGERTTEIRAGSLVTIPQNTLHGIVEIGGAPIRALLIHVV